MFRMVPGDRGDCGDGSRRVSTEQKWALTQEAVEKLSTAQEDGDEKKPINGFVGSQIRADLERAVSGVQGKVC